MTELNWRTLKALDKVRTGNKGSVHKVTITENTVKVKKITAWGDSQKDGDYEIRTIYEIGGDTFEKVN